MTKVQLTTTDTIDQTIATIRSQPQQRRAELLATAARTQPVLDRVLDNLEFVSAEEITAAFRENELARGAAALIDANTNFEEAQAVQRYIDANAAAITEVLFGKLKATLAPEPTVRERIAAVAAGLTEKLRTAVGLERESAALAREHAESFGPAIQAYTEAAKSKIDIFRTEPTFEHYGAALNKIEELKNLISEAAALK